MNKELNTRIKLKVDTETNWESNNPIILDGEIIVIKCTDGTTKFKVGDGTKRYLALDFIDKNLLDQLVLKQNSIDNNLETTSKTIIGAINEVNEKSVLVDTTLTQSGQAADAKVVGDTLNENVSILNNKINAINQSLNDIYVPQVVSGYYTGDGTSSRTIDLGFTPDWVMVWPQKNYGHIDSGYENHPYHGLATKDINQQSSGGSNYPILEVITNGFKIFYKVGSRQNPDQQAFTNKDGIIFKYLAGFNKNINDLSDYYVFMVKK